VRAPVKTLSGGERNRLLLARLFAQPANVLVLDEPTNDLDLDTLELLEALLQDYPGTVILVSHDRAFLDNVVTQLIAFDADGQVREYVGGYSDWIAQRPPAPGPEKPAVTAAARAREKPRLSYRETRELATLPDRIAALEGEQAAISARLADAAFYALPVHEQRSVNARFSEIEVELMACLERWETLEAKQGN
jgi:ATP-binding cassette subfamily F protein uup